MVSWKLAKVSKALTAAVMLGTFLPTSIALASETEDEKSAVTVTSSSEAENPDDSAVLAEETNKDSSSEFELLDYFVTAERIPTSRWDTPADVTVITAKEIEANHYQSIEEAVNHVNGVFFLLDGAALNGTDRTLILVDGRRTNVKPSMKAIERIEIVKGGGSALYGSDAVGGVINIITKKGDHDETTFDISMGSWHTHRYEITNQGNDGRLGWFIAGSIYKSRNHNQKGEPDFNDLLTDHDDNNVTVRLDHRFDDRNSVTFDLMHHSKESNQYAQNFKSNRAGFVFLKPFYNVANDVAATYNFKEGVSTPGFLRYFNNYQSWSTYDYILRPDKGHERLQGVDYQNGWELGQHKLIAGLEWHQTDRYANYKLLETGTEISDSRKVTNSAYYLQDTISMGNKWTLVPGARFDHNSSFGHQWSPKFAANYRSDEKTKIYATWGRVYQAPGLAELYTDKQIPRTNTIGTRYYRGNNNLQPETGHTETIGIEHDFNNKARINFNLFNSKISHLIDLHDHIDGTNEHWDYVNASEYKQRGAELSFAQNIDESWSYDVGYALIHRDINVGAESRITHFSLPKNSYRAGVHYKHGIWKANLLGVMGSSSNGDHYVENDFAALDFNLSCDVTKFATIYTKFLNFTNQGYTYYKNSGHEAGRAFIAGVDCKF